MAKIPGNSLLATSSAILSNGPEHGHPGSSTIPAFLDRRWADRRPPTTATTKNVFSFLIQSLDCSAKS